MRGSRYTDSIQRIFVADGPSVLLTSYTYHFRVVSHSKRASSSVKRIGSTGCALGASRPPRLRQGCWLITIRKLESPTHHDGRLHSLPTGLVTRTVSTVMSVTVGAAKGTRATGASVREGGTSRVQADCISNVSRLPGSREHTRLKVVEGLMRQHCIRVRMAGKIDGCSTLGTGSYAFTTLTIASGVLQALDSPCGDGNRLVYSGC